MNESWPITSYRWWGYVLSVKKWNGHSVWKTEHKNHTMWSCFTLMFVSICSTCFVLWCLFDNHWSMWTKVVPYLHKHDGDMSWALRNGVGTWHSVWKNEHKNHTMLPCFKIMFVRRCSYCFVLLFIFDNHWSM